MTNGVLIPSWGHRSRPNPFPPTAPTAERTGNAAGIRSGAPYRANRNGTGGGRRGNPQRNSGGCGNASGNSGGCGSGGNGRSGGGGRRGASGSCSGSWRTTRRRARRRRTKSGAWKGGRGGERGGHNATRGPQRSPTHPTPPGTNGTAIKTWSQRGATRQPMLWSQRLSTRRSTPNPFHSRPNPKSLPLNTQPQRPSRPNPKDPPFNT